LKNKTITDEEFSKIVFGKWLSVSLINY
jgi:hypothetical protein